MLHVHSEFVLHLKEDQVNASYSIHLYKHYKGKKIRPCVTLQFDMKREKIGINMCLQALQFFYQNIEGNGKRLNRTFKKVKAPRIDDPII